MASHRSQASSFMDPRDKDLEDDSQDEDDAQSCPEFSFTSAFPCLAVVALLVFIPVLVLGSSLLDAFHGHQQAFGPPVLDGPEVTQGWTVAKFPHPLTDSKLCRNPDAAVPTGSQYGFSQDTYICDPDGVLAATEIDAIAARLLQFQRAVKVPCGVGSTNTSLERPFFIGIAVMKQAGLHYGQLEGGDLDTEISWFGDGLLHKWSLSFSQDGGYCPNGAVIVLTTGQRFTKIRLLSEYFMDFHDANLVYKAMRPLLSDGSWKDAILTGIDFFDSYFNTRYGAGRGYSLSYWLCLIAVALMLTVGASCAVCGHMLNQKRRPSEKGSFTGCSACACYFLALVVSFFGAAGVASALGMQASHLVAFHWTIGYALVLIVCLLLCCDGAIGGASSPQQSRGSGGSAAYQSGTPATAGGNHVGSSHTGYSHGGGHYGGGHFSGGGGGGGCGGGGGGGGGGCGGGGGF